MGLRCHLPLIKAPKSLFFSLHKWQSCLPELPWGFRSLGSLPSSAQTERTEQGMISTPSHPLQSPRTAQMGSFPMEFLSTEGWHCRNVRWLELMAIWTEIKIVYLKCLPPLGPQAKCSRAHHKPWRWPCNLLNTSEFLWEHLRREVFYPALKRYSDVPTPSNCRTVFLNFLYMNLLEINIEVKPLWPFGFFILFFLIAISNSKSAWESSQKQIPFHMGQHPCLQSCRMQMCSE